MRLRFLFPFLMLAAAGCQDKTPDPAPAPPGGPPAAAPTTKTTPGPAPALAGSISGKPFTPDKVTFEGGKLSFRKGKEFFADMEIAFDLPKAPGEKLDGKEWTFGGDNFGHPPVTVAAKAGDELPKTEFVFPKDYTMTLKITKHTSRALEGTIDLRVANPANTHLAGPFAAAVEKGPAEAPDADDAPYVKGKMAIAGEWKKANLTAGFVGKGADGKNHSNGGGTNFTPGGNEWMSSTTFKPQVTAAFNSAADGPAFKHVKMAPGEYLVYARRDNVTAAWKKVTVKAGDQLTVDLTIDPAKAGTVVVTLPTPVADDFSDGVSLVPADFDRADQWLLQSFRAGEPKKGDKTVTLKGVPAGKYVVVRGASEAPVEVTAGKETAVTLGGPEPKKK